MPAPALAMSPAPRLRSARSITVRSVRAFLRLGLPVLLGFGLLSPPVSAGTAAPAEPWPPGPAHVSPAGALLAAAATAGRAMASAGPPYAGWAAQGRTFLAFDPRDGGRVIEVVGDLATAERVIVLVPGVGTRLTNFDRGLGGVANRAPARQARTLYAEARAIEPGARLAVVAWLGYLPPGGLGVDAVREELAEQGAAELTRFLAVLAAARPRATVTLAGHSYGAVVLGRAASHLPPQVTDLVALGAPGMGVPHAADLATSARVWAAEAESDWIRRVPGIRVFALGHGRRPADPAFGALALPTTGVRGHDRYLTPGSPTLHALALVGLGRSAEVAR